MWVGSGILVNMASTTLRMSPDSGTWASVSSLWPSDQAPPETTVRLMVAAADAFADLGFHATTTRDIASRAGLSPAGVYVHFRSKEALLFELSRLGHELARDTLLASARQADDATEALRQLIGGFSQWHAEHYQIGRIVQYEFRHLTPDHREVVIELRRQIDEVVADVLRDGVAAGTFAVSDVRGTALALLSMAIDVARWYTPEVRRTPEAIGASYADLAVRLVAA